MASTSTAAGDLEGKPLVLVIGGTGLQGMGCIYDLLETKRFRVRTMTRNTASKYALRLKDSGVEVLPGNLLDIPAVDRAMNGVQLLFAATFSDHDGTEVVQGRNLGDAAVRAGTVKRVVFSGGERIGVDVMDNKAKIEDYFRTLPLPHVVYLHTAFFYENVATKRGTKRVKVDKQRRHYRFSIPLLQDTRIPFISPTDIGRFGAFVLEQPQGRFKRGEVVPIAGDIISPQDFVQAFATITGKQAVYEQLSLDFFRRLPIPGAELIVHMYTWYHDGCPGEGHDRDPAATRALCPRVRNLEEWLRSDGVELIERMATTDTWLSRINDVMLWAFMHAYGAVVRLRTLLLPPPPPAAASQPVTTT